MLTITVSVQEKKDTLNKITLLLRGKLLSMSFSGSSYDTLVRWDELCKRRDEKKR